MSFTIEKTLRVYDEKEAVYLELRPNPDFPDAGFEITTNGVTVNEDWYGKVSLSINSKEHAQKLAQAILEMAEEIND